MGGGGGWAREVEVGENPQGSILCSSIPTPWRHSFLESKERHLSQEKAKWWESG